MANIKSNGYTINAMTNTVTITKDFAKRANNINSPEYKTLNQLRKDGYSIEYKTINVKEGKKTHKGLTLAFMRQYINEQENSNVIRAEFEKIKREFNGHHACYANLKKYFLNQFPELTAAGIKEYLTIDFMDNYIEYQDNRDAIIGGYNKVKAVYNGQPDYHEKVKEYFLKQFPELTVTQIKQEIGNEKATIDIINEHEAAKAAKQEMNETITENETAENKENAA